MKTWLAVASIGVVASFALSAVADDDLNGDRQKRSFRARLVGLNEVPSVSTEAHGQFYAVVNKDSTAFTYWLSYSGLTADASQSHIHFGQHHTNGGISVWLCQGSAVAPPAVAARVPICAPRATTEPITATITAADVIGPTGQGIGAGEFAEILEAMRAGAAYANVHSAAAAPAIAFPGGEIRGQIN